MGVVILEHNKERIIDHIKKPLLDNHHYQLEETPSEETSNGTLAGEHVTTTASGTWVGEPFATIDTDTDTDADEKEKEDAPLSSHSEPYDISSNDAAADIPTNVYFDNKQDTRVGNYLKGKGLDVDIQQALTAVISAKTDGASGSSGQPDNLQVDIVDEVDEEVIELEFERAVQKIHTHQGYEMYCPNCSTRVTKVVLRRRIVKKTPVKTDKREDLLGCLSCFSIFVAAGNKLNPLRMFGRDKETKSSSVSSTQSSAVQQQQQSSSSFSSATQVNDTTSTTITSSTQVKDTTSTITSST